MNDFRECLYNCKNDVSMLKLYFGPNASNDNIQTFIESWNYKSVMNKCLDKAKYNLSSETGLGEKAKIAFMIVMRDDKRYEYTDKQFELMKTDFENITGHKVCFKSSSDVILECNKLFEGNTKDLYKKRTKQFYVLRGFEDFKRFSNQIKASLKFLEYIEGKLINNKEPHYDEYNAHPITIEDYQELRKPIPLLHEDSYELYLMRLKRLKCVPFDEETWSTDMNELKQDHEKNP
ncbi:uncharacterized protein LOC111042088 [Myzus persicae]|uniref:uncharacterized protein LOC111042088 n=1 Tax=Myzus persicae TaxID=13164 RepID=UPI000B937A56|nr:uncharacterized protein LOC111042088 [Myzus persicae]